MGRQSHRRDAKWEEAATPAASFRFWQESQAGSATVGIPRGTESPTGGITRAAGSPTAAITRGAGSPTAGIPRGTGSPRPTIAHVAAPMAPIPAPIAKAVDGPKASPSPLPAKKDP